MRHEKPEQLIMFERMMDEIFKQGPPKFCHNCMYYSTEGRCQVFDMEPPKAFTDIPNECPEWCMEPPF